MNNPMNFIDSLGLWCDWYPAPYNTLVCGDDSGSGGGVGRAKPVMEQVDDSNVNAGGGGPGGNTSTPQPANNSFLGKLKQAYCSAVPNGSVVGLSGSAGSVAGVTGTLEGVRNWDTGETSFFYSGGGTAGLVGLQGNLFGGVVWGLNQGNTNYKAGSTTASASVGPVGGSASFNSPGPKNPSGAINPANWSRPASLTLSLGVSNVPFSGTLSVTSYSDPKLTTVTPSTTIVDQVGMLLRSICH